MSPDVWLLIGYFLLALSISFLCSLLEAVLLSVSRGHIEIMIKKKAHSGELLKKFKDDVDRPLAAILTFNTISHTIGASGVGTQVKVLWPDVGWAGTFSAVILTILILILSEVIPKTIGAVYCNRLSSPAAYAIQAMMWPLKFGVQWALEKVSDLVSPAGMKVKISREEVMAVADLSHEDGVLHQQENRIIQNILHLKNIRAKDVLTPRAVVLAFSGEQTIGEVVDGYSPIRFSRIPIYDKDLDTITGLVNRYQILQGYSKGGQTDKLSSIAQPIHAIPDTKTLASTLEVFIDQRQQLFLVVDEYGGTEGIISLEDVIETLLGVEIVDEFDQVKDMRKLAKQIWERRQKSLRD